MQLRARASMSDAGDERWRRWTHMMLWPRRTFPALSSQISRNHFRPDSRIFPGKFPGNHTNLQEMPRNEKFPSYTLTWPMRSEMWATSSFGERDDWLMRIVARFGFCLA